jgi:hypothetical protein
MKHNAAERIPWWRVLLCTVIVGLLASYIFAVLTGRVWGDRKLDATHFTAIALATVLVVSILSPAHFSALRLFELGGLKIEFARVRGELETIRSVGLVRSIDKRHVHDMKDLAEFDLAEFVELTPAGREWARRIEDLARSEEQTEAGR